MRVLLKRVGKPLEEVQSDKQYRTDCAAQFLGESRQERVYWSDTLAMVCDEIGLYKQLPLNFLMEIKNPFHPIQRIVGDVVFIRTKPLDLLSDPWDAEVEDIRDEDIAVITDLLSEEKQNILAFCYAARIGARGANNGI